jgi:hypothetical protein
MDHDLNCNSNRAGCRLHSPRRPALTLTPARGSQGCTAPSQPI